MNYRERMLATIRSEPTDRIPFAPRMDLWAIALRARGTIPERFAGLNMVEVARELDLPCHAVGADYSLPGGRDVTLRGLGMDNHSDYPYRIELQGLPFETSDDGVDLRTRIETPAGEVFTHLHRSPQMKRDGISLPFVRSYAIESMDDLEALGLVFDHLVVVATPESYAAFHERVGTQGIAVARGPIGASPMHLILHELMPMDQFFYAYADHRDLLRSLCQRMEPLYERWLDVLAESSAEVVFWGANYDQDLTWPPFFREEIVPWLQRVSVRLHAAGKLVLTHTDGENRALMALYRECGFDVAESVCPKPMTLLTLAELRQGMGSDITIWGGIPSVALLDDAMNAATFDAYLDEVFGALGSGERLILGVSDNVPPDANLDRIRLIAERVAAFGPVT